MKAIEQEIQRIKNLIAGGKKIEVSLSSIKEQLELFYNGVKIPVLSKPCTIGDGIKQFEQNEIDDLYNHHTEAIKNYKLVKFVPASGAASRMFQKLLSVLNRYDDFSLDDLLTKSDEDKECKYVSDFLLNIKSFAFYDDLKNVLNVSDDDLIIIRKNNPAKILRAVLFNPGLDYASKPKGAIKFHKYNSAYRTAFEEQVYESINYIADSDDNIRIHFTISEEHEKLFLEIINKLKTDFNDKYNLEITYSFQKKSTDTIAVDNENNIILDINGNIVLRPGGHGALIENLNDIDADIVVLKNIDNLSKENFSDETIKFKKLLIGLCMKLQKKVFDLLRRLDELKIMESDFDEISVFLEKELFISKPSGFENWDPDKKVKHFHKILNRPIRVCGMVKNEGEPGGGPFWINEPDGSLSVQIIEQAQINLNDENQKSIFKKSTHFNPVDIVCGIKDYKGNKFNLNDFVDNRSGIITKKSKDGVELKALELPGLWNGSMANWITVFVEVPISTFNPVKEINDLLKPAHQ